MTRGIGKNEDGMAFKHMGSCNELIAVVWLLRQGYEVFRNVSVHGPVDIIAMKDGDTVFFDAKKVAYRAGGVLGQVKITKEQADLKVKVIRVFPDGNCSIDFDPPVIGVDELDPIACRECSRIFTPSKKYSAYCGVECSRVFNARRLMEWKKQNKLQTQVIANV